MIGHYIIHFESILFFILLLIQLIYFIIFERLIQYALKRVLLMSLCESITVTVHKCYVIIAVKKSFDTFWKKVVLQIRNRKKEAFSAFVSYMACEVYMSHLIDQKTSIHFFHPVFCQLRKVKYFLGNFCNLLVQSFLNFQSRVGCLLE